MKKFKNIIIVVLILVFGIILIYGLKTWSSEGKTMVANSSNSIQLTSDKTSSVLEIKITSDNNFKTGNITNTPVTLAVNSMDLKDIYVNGSSLGKANEALLEVAGAYEVIAQNNDGKKVILKFTIDPVADIPSGGVIKGSSIKSETYTGEIKQKKIEPVIKAQYPESLTNGGTVSVDSVTLAYSSESEIVSVTLDDEKMEIIGTVTSYMPGKHIVVVTDSAGMSSTFTFTNN